MKTLSAIIGLILISGLVVKAEIHVTRQWFDNQIIDNDTLTYNLPKGTTHMLVETRGAMYGVKEAKGKSPQSWGIEFVMIDGTHHDVTIGWGNTIFGDFTDESYLSVAGLETDTPVRFTRNVNTHDGPNTLIVDVGNDNLGKVFVGDDLVNYAGCVHLQSRVADIKLFSHGKLEILTMCVESGVPVDLNSGLDDDAIAEASRTGQEAPLGLWHYFDRDNDALYAQPGGNYDLLVVRDPADDARLLILYLSGARVNADQWHTGMIKGVLTPTHFKGRYNLKWYDAGLEPVDDECHASVENDILTVHFPLHHSQLRYSR